MREFDGVAVPNPRFSSNGNSRIVTQTTVALLVFLSAVSLILLGVTAATLAFLRSSPVYSPSSLSNAASVSPLGLPGFDGLAWPDILALARGQSVSFWAAPVESYDDWIDQFLTPKVAAFFGITLERVGRDDRIRLGARNSADTKRTGSRQHIQRLRRSDLDKRAQFRDRNPGKFTTRIRQTIIRDPCF